MQALPHAAGVGRGIGVNCELTGPPVDGQLARIPPVGIHAIGGPHRDEPGGNDLARDVGPVAKPRQTEPGGPCLVGDDEGVPIGLSP